ncbi:hypothetical protein AJ80_04661 [Polytolypa hystricis UAMH7299]|uniref:Origin recognition complex subunit 4 n=1 Tax=Polytolypa hystricis (strain UAMH7299) TaxID=1447883 RepID=A0A2B7YA89_POLH7|nr:hypothetical protein AJ80_04661 [Polytolypa hystricis UAMH7299]
MNKLTATRPSKRRKVLGEDIPNGDNLRSSGRVLRARALAPQRAQARESSHNDEDEDDHGGGDGPEEPPSQVTTTARSTRRQTGSMRKATESNKDEDVTTTATTAEQADHTPAEPRLRTSGRRRIAPKRYVNDIEAEVTTGWGNKKAPVQNSGTERTTRGGSKRVTRARAAAQPSPAPSRVVAERDEEEDGSLWDVPVDENEIGRDKEDSGAGRPDDEDELIISAQQLQQELVEENEHITEPPKDFPPYAEEFKILCEDNMLDHLSSLVTLVLEKLTRKRLIPLQGLDVEYHTVHQLVEQTVIVGEGNSLLLLGSRGSGKTAVVETAISSLTKDHGDDFHVVRLNGFLHTDDRIALKEIWRQLGRETNMEDEMNKITSYADTMASLLALLSHPEELFGVSEDPDVVATAKSVIIILDEFDLFTYHPRQTLLYNLFDIAQARKAPVAVLGLTTRVDVTENLEKRVKSRFSHRYVFLPRPKSFVDFSEICMAALDIEESELAEDHGNAERNEKHSTLLKGWRKYLQGLFADSTFQSHLQQIYFRTKSAPDFFSSALLPFSTFYQSIISASSSSSTTTSPDLILPTADTFITSSLACADPSPLPFPPSSTSSSTSTTSLPLSLLLTATRITALHDPGLNTSSTTTTPAPLLTLSFPAVYTEYVRLLTSAKASASASGATATAGRVWGRDAAREAWEKLVGWGLVVPAGSSGGAGDGRMYRIEISFEDVVQGVGSGAAGALGRWWRET